MSASRRNFVTLVSSSGWRGRSWVVIAALIFAALPEARALVATGFLGGVVIGVFLILVRQQRGSGPRRGTPIVLFHPMHDVQS